MLYHLIGTGTPRAASRVSIAEALGRQPAGSWLNIAVRTGVDAPTWRERAQDDLVLALAIGLWMSDQKIRVPKPSMLPFYLGR